VCAECATHQAHRLAYYRLLINVIGFLSNQKPCYIVANRAGEIWVKQEYLTEGAHDWFDIACAVWFELHGAHVEQDCICPACIEVKYPLLRFQEESQ
jgi:hypothetical protein